jgi:nucleoside-diphosphate-sugar epimerase
MILITGATGFIGQNLLKKIGDHDLRILCRHDAEKMRIIYPNAEIVQGDITDKSSLIKAASDVDTIIHLAAMISYKAPKLELMKVNFEGTKNLLEACKNVKKFIFSSSVSVMGEIKGIADENYPCRPENNYGFSKLKAENVIIERCDELGIQYVILRIAPLYGVGSPIWEKNLRLLEKGFPIPNTKNLTHVVHISDVVQSLTLALKTKRKGIYIIADKQPIRFTEFAEKILSMLGKKPKKYPFWLVKLIASFSGMGPYFKTLTMNRNYDISKARKDLGYNPEADLDTELKNMIEWYKKLK